MTISSNNFPVVSVFPTQQSSSIQANQAVSAHDLKSLGHQINFLNANGKQLITNNSLYRYANTGDSFKVAFSLRPTPAVNDRYWTFNFKGENGVMNFNIEISSSVSATLYQLATNPGFTFQQLREPIATTSPTLDANGFEAITVTMTAVSSTAAASMNTYIMNIGCFELSRNSLMPVSAVNDSGSVDIVSLNPGQPLYTAGQYEYASIGGLAKGVKQAEENKNNQLFSLFTHWYKNATTYSGLGLAAAYNTSSLQNMFTGQSVPRPIVFARNQNLNVLSRSCWIRAFGNVGAAGNVGSLQITSSVDRVALSFNNTVPTWRSASLMIQTDDPRLPYGFNTSSFINSTGNLDVNMIKTTQVDTSNPFNIWSFEVWED
jgi:hypothetical protein